MIKFSKKEIIEFGVYVLVTLLPWQTRWIVYAGKINGEASEYLSYSLYAVDILLCALLIATFFFFQKKIITSVREFLFEKKTWKHWISTLTVLVGIFSIYFAQDKFLALYFEVKTLLALGFFLLLIKIANKTRVAIFFVCSLFAPAILAVWQFLAQQTFSEKWLGLSLHQASVGGTSVIEVFSNGILSERWIRAYGSFDHPNILGGVFALGISVCLWFLAKWQEKKGRQWEKFFVFIMVVILSAGLFASFSRSAWLALFLSVLSSAIFLFLQKKKKYLKKWSGGAGVTVIVFLIMFLSYQNLVNVRTQGKTRLENLSMDQRGLYLRQSVEVIGSSPFFGVGAGNYIVSLKKMHPENPSWTYQPVHNVFLYIESEMGILGLILFIFFLCFMFWQYGKRNYMSMTLLVSLLPGLFLDHWLWSLHFGVLFFAMIAAFIVGFSGKEKV